MQIILSMMVVALVGGVGMYVLWLMRQHSGRSRLMGTAGMATLLIVLAACRGTQNSIVVQPIAPTTAPATLAPTTTAQGSEEWTTYHLDSTHTGYQPSEPDPEKLTNAWVAKLDGSVYAEPLVVNGSLIVATENDTLYALNPMDGSVLWRTHVGTPIQQSTLPCGDINPLGITGTPVYDPATGLVFAVAEVSGPHHILVGVDEKTGRVRVNRSVDLASMDPKAYQQRSALLLSQNKVYVAFGGLAGDCSDYRGTVVASQTNGQGALLSYIVPVAREGGIWGPSGPTVDADGNIYVSVGNGAATSGAWDHSDSVLKLSPTLQLESAFAPSGWQEENSHDTDLGSMGPTLLSNDQVFVAGKSGAGYLLNAHALGGVGGQEATTQICSSGLAMGGTAVVGLQVFVPCTDGLRAVTIGPGAKMTVNWDASTSYSPPVIGGHTVYDQDANGTLYAYAIDSGALRAKISLGEEASGGIPHFATPTIVGGRIFVPTLTGVSAVNIA